MADNMGFDGDLYREIAVQTTCHVKFKELTINTGASASTLQDIKVPDTCGSFTYKESGLPHSSARNRFIYWRTNNDVLELVEECLDYNLTDPHLKFRFQDTPILGGISIHETPSSVVLLVATVASVHRLVFPHPNRLPKPEASYAASCQPISSVFYDASLSSTCDPQNTHMLNPGGSITSQLYGAATYLNSDGEALYAIASSVGSVVLVVLPPQGIQGVVQQFELSQSSVMQKLWTGLVPAAIRGGQEAIDSATSLVLHPIRGDAHVIAVCRDHKLRIWSTKKRECILISNLLEFTSDGMHGPNIGTGGTGHIIKKVLCHDVSVLGLCVYLNFQDKNQFLILQPEFVSGRLRLQHMATLFSPTEDLIDYCVTQENLWTLWTNSSGENVARVLKMPGGRDTKGANWSEVVLHPQESSDIMVPAHQDPREVYLNRIFQPGLFSIDNIQRALNVYRRSLETAYATDPVYNINTLKEEVTVAVETEIRNAALDYEIREEDYYQLQIDQWSKFYSCCIQYKEVGAKLKGLLVDCVTGLVCFIRKKCLTYIRPCDKMEEVYLDSHAITDLSMMTDVHAQDDWIDQRDIRTVCGGLDLINGEISDDIALQLEYQLGMGVKVETLVEQMVDSLFFNNELGDGSVRADSLMTLLEMVKHLPNAIEAMLKSLDLSQTTEDEFNIEETDMNAVRQFNCGQLFSSLVAMDIVWASLKQYTHTRFCVLRDLLILQIAALRLGDKHGITPVVSNTLKNDLIPQTVPLLQAYFLVKWSNHTVASSAQTSSLDFNTRQLASMDISDAVGLTNQKKAPQNASLAAMFIQGVGGEQAKLLLAQTSIMEEFSTSTMSHGFMALIRIIAKLLWPISDNFLFPEFLVGSCQYLALQEYVHLLQGWCDWNGASRKFLLGLSYLHFDEANKAAQCFTEAKEGVATEPFLYHKLLNSEEMNTRNLEILYYLKVIKQFEEFGVPDVVISLAKTAIGIAEDDDPNLPTLWSKVFKYHLELGHNTEAYAAMIANPDPSRRKDCLRQLLVMLCERGDLQALVEFPYIDLEDEVVSILESRARSVDLATHNYYDLLYAFHIFRSNFRRAGSAMHEHAMRLGFELMSKRGLQRQAQCYLAALNSLRLVNPDYAWIVKPVHSPKSLSTDEEGDGSSPKRTVEGNDKPDSLVRKMEIVELSDIERDFLLVDARLRLMNHDPDPALMSGPTPSRDEMVGLLVNSGLFDRAVIICRAFSLPLNTVIESLTLKCINLAKNSSYQMRGDNDYTAQAWNWIKENRLALTHVTKESSAADQAWYLLQQYLACYEDKTARYHRCAAIKLLSHGFVLPTWFINSYKGLNAAELLRLYIDYGLLEEAVGLAVEYIDAVEDTFTGRESVLFKLPGCLKHCPLTAWVPSTSISQLLLTLRDKQDVFCGKLYNTLEDKVQMYEMKVHNLSRQLIEP